jgi:hypothetical protein
MYIYLVNPGGKATGDESAYEPIKSNTLATHESAHEPINRV